MDINKRLNSLTPYVTGIRFISGMTLIDCMFKDNWHILKSDNILYGENDTPNYYMFYSEDTDSITIDNLLDYIESIINYNIEEENKSILFEVMCNDLKEVFLKNKLSDLNTLKFTFGKQENYISPKVIDNVGVDPQPVLNKISSDDNLINKTKEPLKINAISDSNIVLDDNTVIKAVCKCVGSEQCSVCLGID